MTDWTPVLTAGMTALASLGTALIATLGVVQAQQRGARSERRKASAERRNRQRQERKETLTRFLAAARAVELMAEALEDGGTLEETEAHRTVAEMWFAHSEVQLVCAEQTWQAAGDFAFALRDTARGWHPPDRKVWEVLATPRNEFLAAARAELELLDIDAHAGLGATGEA